jgi:hypothetical protein
VQFVAWIMSNDATLSGDERDAIAMDLVRAGCRYAVCSGPDGTLWDDAVDAASLKVSCLQRKEPVMTTWHDDETFEEIAEFFACHTSFDDYRPDTFILVGIGPFAQLDEAQALVARLLNVESATQSVLR